MSASDIEQNIALEAKRNARKKKIWTKQNSIFFKKPRNNITENLYYVNKSTLFPNTKNVFTEKDKLRTFGEPQMVSKV